MGIFFCNLYSSWKKGRVDNVMSLTKRFWPKKTDSALIIDEDIVRVENRLNTRPRKRFVFRSPYEMLCVALTF